MSPQVPFDQLIDQVGLLLKELALTGRWLLPSLERPMETLKSGRSPRAIDLAGQMAESEGMLSVLGGILQDLHALLPELRRHYMDWNNRFPQSPAVEQLGKNLPEIEREWAYWQAFAERCRALLKKLRLIADEEKLSPLARAPLNDAWEEVVSLARR